MGTSRTMKLLRPSIVLLGVFAAAAADPQPTITVHGPTIVAFFEPITESELIADPDTNEALSDFQFYAGGARKAFLKTGIDFHEIYVRSFRIRIGSKTTTFRVGKVGVGYYFVAPGKRPRVEYGVLQASNILEIAEQYFGKVGN
jgi:hypothetical protein